MAYSHIWVIHQFTEELKQLARLQRAIAQAKRTVPNNPHAQALLDERNVGIISRKIKIADAMFEIQRSN